MFPRRAKGANALVADTGYGANADFRHGLEDRGLAYALQARDEMTAHAETAEPYEPPYGGLGPRPLPRYRTPPVSLREHVLAAGRDQTVAVTWRKGSKAAMSARFVFLRVHLAGRRPKPAPDGVIALRWLIAQWPEGENEPVKYWISNLPADAQGAGDEVLEVRGVNGHGSPGDLVRGAAPQGRNGGRRVRT